MPEETGRRVLVRGGWKRQGWKRLSWKRWGLEERRLEEAGTGREGAGTQPMCAWAQACSGTLCPLWSVCASLVLPGPPSRDALSVSGGEPAICSSQWKPCHHQLPRSWSAELAMNGSLSIPFEVKFRDQELHLQVMVICGLDHSRVYLVEDWHPECFLRILDWILLGVPSENSQNITSSLEIQVSLAGPKFSESFSGFHSVPGLLSASQMGLYLALCRRTDLL